MNNRLDHIFLDMDGVVSDFISASLRLHNRIDALADWPPGERDIPKVLGVSKGQFWKVIDAQGGDFWSSLTPFPWNADLISLVREFGPLTVLTAPSLSPSCVEGKVRWLYEHFPKENGKRFTDFLIGPRKELLAQPGRVLIDDADVNVEAFRKAGGHAVLFPQPWNSNFMIHDRLSYMRLELERLSSLAHPH